MRTKIDVALWERKAHFNFFNSFEEPFFGATVNVDCTDAYQKAKEQGVSFFLYYLHSLLVAANKIEAFKYRIDNNEVFIYDEVHAAATISRPNGTFGFSYIDYKPALAEFIIEAQQEILRVQSATDLIPSSTLNLLHISAIPWDQFYRVNARPQLFF